MHTFQRLGVKLLLPPLFMASSTLELEPAHAAVSAIITTAKCDATGVPP